jgi:hypothetical protein
LLKLREEKLREIEELGDYWERQTVTEREMRRLRIAELSQTGIRQPGKAIMIYLDYPAS